MKTGILILLTLLIWNLQVCGQMIPENDYCSEKNR